MAAIPPVCDFGWKAVEFNLPATSGEMISLAQSRGENGTLVMFICNHCPYVLSILDRIIRDARELSDLGIGVVAISANDALTYPQDSFENMARLSEERAFPSPIFMMRPKPSRAPMMPPAHLISLGLMQKTNCNIAVA